MHHTLQATMSIGWPAVRLVVVPVDLDIHPAECQRRRLDEDLIAAATENASST